MNLTIKYRIMKKIFMLCVLVTMSSLLAIGQLKVANNSGQDLNVTVNGQKNLVPYKATKTFQARGQNIWLEAATLNNSVKISIQKSVPRNGQVTIEANDLVIAAPAPQSNAQGYSSVSSIATVSPVSTGASLAAVLKGNSGSENKTQAVSLPATSYSSVQTQNVLTPVSPVYVAKATIPQINTETITFIYKGEDRFKIFSEIGRGLEFKGADTLNPEDNAKNRYDLMIKKNQDLIIGIGIKEGENQAIWRYAEIRKRINSWDQECYIFQKDLKQMSTAETRKLRIRLMAEDYKIFFEPETGDPISIGFREKSEPIEVPVGQFYIRVSYTYPNGMFHQTVFVAKHVTDDKYLEITKQDLDNAIQLNW